MAWDDGYEFDALLPVVILFIIAQRKFIENASRSGIKG